MANPSIERKYLILITTVSLLVPILVAVLLYSPFKIESSHVWIYSLPHLNALLNTVTALLLVLGWLFIKQKKVVMHKNTMVMAFILGTVFLIAYVIYHASAETTVYGDTIGNGLLTAQELAAVGFWRMIYLIVLISHILLAAVVVPLVLLALFYAFTKRIAKHRKIVRYTWPIWLYVSVSGVIVYFMIKPYYQH